MGSLSSMRAAKVADHFGESSPSGVIAGSVQHFSLQPPTSVGSSHTLCSMDSLAARPCGRTPECGRKARAVVGIGGATHHLEEHDIYKMTAALCKSRRAGLTTMRGLLPFYTNSGEGPEHLPFYGIFSRPATFTVLCQNASTFTVPPPYGANLHGRSLLHNNRILRN